METSKLICLVTEYAVYGELYRNYKIILNVFRKSISGRIPPGSV